MPSSVTTYQPLKLGQTAKTGAGIATISRPVHDTCPLSCAHWDDCYALRGHMATPVVKRSWAENHNVEDWPAWSDALSLQLASTPAVGVRLHIGGDFLSRGKVDRPYLAALLSAFRRSAAVRSACGFDPLPAWVYTSAWLEMIPHRAALVRAGIEVFASVHTLAQAIDARGYGYRLAWCSALKKTDVLKMPKSLRPRGVLPSGPEGELRIPICPEQTGNSPDCATCGLCFHKGGPDVAFLTH